MNRYAVLFLFLALSIIPRKSICQTLLPGDPMESYLRLLPESAFDGPAPSFHLRPVQMRPAAGGESAATPHPWMDHPFFRSARSGSGEAVSPERTIPRLIGGEERPWAFYTPVSIYSYNSTIPFGQNDGALWQGRGSNAAFSFGGRFDYGPLHLSLRPQIGYSSNFNFALSPLQSHPSVLPLGAPLSHRSIDLPQRFGFDPLQWIDPGHSTLSLRFRGVETGASTASFWSGPAQVNPLVHGNSSPGFFHLFLGTYRPVPTPAGALEGRLYWGSLDESDWFDRDPANDRRFVTGLLLSWSPSFARGLHLGVSRTHYEYYPDGGLTSAQLFRIFEPLTGEHFFGDGNPFGVPDNSQMITLFGRWAFPEHGLEIYGEWGSNNRPVEASEFLLQPEHGRAWTVGLQKRFRLPQNTWLLFLTEWSDLSSSRTHQSRTFMPWYEENQIRQGWTHRGQLLGAGIGPGSSARLFSLTWIESWGWFGLSFKQVTHNNDRLRSRINWIFPLQTTDREIDAIHQLEDREFRLGAHALLFLPWDLEASVELTHSDFVNRHNIADNSVSNANIFVTLRYRLPGLLR